MSYTDRKRSRQLQRRYGITLSDFYALLESQDFACAICKRPESTKNGADAIRLAVDHCHGTNRVRGLLCLRCNRALGLLQDNTKYLTAALAYLTRSKEGK